MFRILQKLSEYIAIQKDNGQQKKVEKSAAYQKKSGKNKMRIKSRMIEWSKKGTENQTFTKFHTLFLKTVWIQIRSQLIRIYTVSSSRNMNPWYW